MENLHIGIILDGNRRHAQHQGKQPWEGHKEGATTVEQLFSWITELPVHTFTLYAWSMQNFQRNALEKKFIFEVMEKSLEKLLTKKEDLITKDIRVRFLGRLSLFPEKIQQTMQTLMDATANHTKYTINFCMAYGGREEIIDAAQAVIAAGEDMNEENLQKHLYLSEEPDFIIRTSGEQRTSNFLPWQSTYSEWFFLEKNWPAMTKEDIAQCITSFTEHRQRRFGK